MFLFLAMIGLIASIFLFFAIVSGDSSETLVMSFISMLFSTVVCFKFAKMDKKIKDNEDEIAKLKTHLGIKNGDRVNNNPDNAEQCVDYDEDFSEYEWVKVTDSNCKDSYNNVYDEKKDE